MKRVQLNTIEELKHLKDYYYIEENGRLYGYRGREMSDTLSGNGYVHNVFSTEIGRKTLSRHRLVALAFIDNPENKPYINHIDENRENNNIENLEWCTQAENVRHGTGIERASQSRSKPVIGTCMSTGKQVEFSSIDEAGQQGFHQSAISSCCNGKRNTHKGYIWEFKE